MSKLSNKSVVFILILVMTLLITGCGGSKDSVSGSVGGKVYKWRMVTHQMPGTSRYEDTIVPFVKAVEEASGGRLIIEPYGAGVLFPVSETIDNVKNGIIEASASWDGNWAGKNPLFGLAGNIPADPIKNFSEHFYRADKLESVLAKAYEDFGVTYVGAFDYGPPEILMSTKPINNLSEFKGLNIRTAGIGGDFYSKLGASVVSISSQEIYTALQLGTVDAAEYNDWIVNMEMGFDEVTKYVIEPVLHTGGITDKSFVVNPKAWDQLPDDLKEIVKVCLDLSKFTSATAYDVGSKLAKAEFLESGATIVELPEADVKEANKLASQVVLDYASKNELCKEYVDKYIEVLVNLGYIEEANNLGYKGK